MAVASPKPLMTILAPWAAMARAMARPMPLVEPVTRAVLDFRDMGRTPGRETLGRGGVGTAVAGEVVDDNAPAHRLVEPVGVGQRAPHVRLARGPMFLHRDAGELVVL